MQEVMTTEVRAIHPAAPLAEVLALMRDLRPSWVVVCEKAKPVGIISERDIARAGGDPKLAAATAADVMTSPVVSIAGDVDVADAVARLRQQRIQRLPVVDEAGHLAGLVTQTDLLNTYTRMLESDKHELERRVEERTRELRQAAERFEALSLEDPLLRIGNRRSMELALDRVHQLSRRHQRVYTVVLVDVDHFKKYNDGYGHAAGDRVLALVAQRLQSLMRGSDAVYRYGGEEILVLLPETDLRGARSAAERLRAEIARIGLPHQGSPHGVLTVSCGVASVVVGEGRDERWRCVVERADAALYRAKAAGRNRAEVEGPPRA